jgi:cytochrome bd-type quinol oxidase subunit 1
MENVTTGHWIFAGVFALVFVVGIVYAYKDDIRKRPDLFSGSSKFLLSVILIIMILLVIKMISRLG